MFRAKNDFYPTPAWLTEAIMPVLKRYFPPDITYLEPSCGDGAIVRVLDTYFHGIRLRYDIVKSGLVAESTDFLTLEPKPVVDLIITNPPYCLAEEFVKRSFLWRRNEDSLVVMLLRLSFLGSRKRAKWLRENTPAVYVTPRRPAFIKNKYGKLSTDCMEYAWFIWGSRFLPIVAILETEDTGKNESPASV